jgi:drug/metabolite transporter (DMT)-like permease
MQPIPATSPAPARHAKRLLRGARIGWVLAITATVAYSFAPPVARAAIVGGFNSTSLLMARMLLATTLFAVTLAFTAGRELRMSRQGVTAAILVGAVNAAGMICFFFALNYLEASLSAMILALSPPIVLSLLALGGEKLTRRHLVRVTLALVGVYLLVGPTGQVNWVGAGLALLATFLFSLNTALTQWTLVGYPARGVAFYVTASLTFFVVLWWLYNGAEWSSPGLGGWLAVIVLAVVSTYLARLTFFAAVGHVGGSQLSLLAPLETMLSVVWSILFLQETLTPLQAVGGVLILVSALLAVKRLGRVRFRFPRTQPPAGPPNV